MSVLTIIQARLSSTRLPRKILLPIAGKSILQHVYDAAPEPKVVAVPAEDYQEIFLHLNGLVYPYPGPVNDVLGRFYSTWQAMVYNRKADPTWILRLTADCPMLTREMVNGFLKTVVGATSHMDLGGYWVIGDINPFTIYTNRPWDPDGTDMELFSVKDLAMAHEQATDPYDREHVTPWLYRHLNVRRFSIFGREPQPENPADKVSVDTLEDYEKVKKLMEAR